MSLSDAMKSAAKTTLSKEALERVFVNELKPLISFLERAAEFDNGHPDAFPEEIEKGDVYQEDGMNNRSYGFTLEHSVSFWETPESDRGRAGQGRSLEVSIWAKDHQLYDQSASLFTFNLFEGGGVMLWPNEYQVTNRFDAPKHILEAMKTIIQKYAEVSRNPVRVMALAEIAAEEYNGHFEDSAPKPVTKKTFARFEA